ncbi:hypothetical protein BN7_541 [Wickerhamomyces ciferrii]|uniref:Uncharacterized protein n=1 Tax=Wickerhamomyces ciferrii (strain ATCC 14091 / BCRC 22168 / CBS 111 / JCM 3599 / NBRC 0793 / NRRL Y-1031 F-60-10) TaxID=1206466 RepID=K0KHX4_WICCF|nr:uncharacterized protein BN7_541 [Wickerhamomyces ciferrii]CCH41004.1 hypothetical protein BN7_541 [Wickerhamomyces ciferrii]
MSKSNTLGKLAEATSKTLKSKPYQKKPQGNKLYPDPKVARFLSKTDPIRKEEIQDQLFTQGSGLPRLSKINPAASRSILQGGDDRSSGIPRMGSNNMFGLSSTGRLQRNIDYSNPKDVQWMTFETKKPEISQSYKEIIEDNSILLIINDISDTATDVNYKNKIEGTIKAFESVPNTTKFLNIQKEMFIKLLENDPILYKCLANLRIQPSSKVGKLGSFMKLISIPSHAIEITPKIIDVLQANKGSYKLVSLYVNLDRSPQLAQDLISISKDFTSDTKEMNYESLLKKAIDSHTEDSTSKSILKKIGESNLLKLSTTDKSISFIIADTGKTDINHKITS